ncbi:MAG: hypothetical protein ABL901_03205 [Hyphomicrobiaceae bacterium]
MITQPTPSKKPTHRIYAVSKRQGDINNWTEIGAAWPHTDGKGFNLKLEYLPLNAAELVIRVPKPKGEGAPAGELTRESEGGDL